MKAIVRRLARIEVRLAPTIDLASYRLADLLRERRRRRLEASGQPFESRSPVSVSSGRVLSVAETLRLCRQERSRRQRAAREQV
jgi:hypothetical protein